MAVKGLHHVAVICSDYEVSKRFYTEVLGFKIINEEYRKERDSYKLDLRLGNMQLELFSFPDAPKRLSYPEAAGLRHLALAVHSLDEEIDALRRSGVEAEPIRIDESTKKRFTFVKDPDNLPIELYEV
jgi:glyoxylase I family protein